MTHAKFPLWPTVDGKCTCSDDCDRAGKHPRVAWASFEGAVAEGEPYGIATGRRSGFFAVDIDIKRVDGETNLARLGELTESYEVTTPSGGAHVYYSLPDFPVPTCTDFPCEGVDIRGEGGFVVGPGSMGKNGQPYTVAQEGPINDAPRWLLDILRAKAHERLQLPEKAVGYEPVTGEDLALAMAKGERFLRDTEPCVSGQGGNDRLWRTCLRLTKGLRLPEDAALALLGPYNSRCLPPWDEATLSRNVQRAARESKVAPGDVADGCRWDGPKAAPVPVTDDRQRPDPNHRYTIDVYANSGGSEKTIPIEIREASAVLTNLRDEWRGVWQWDEFAERIIAINPPFRLDAETKGFTDDDALKVQLWFGVCKTRISKDMTADAIRNAARARPFHPVKDYLARLPRATTRHLESFEKFFGRDDAQSGDFVRKWLIAAVARVYSPGCQVDTVLTLCGARGGEKKSTFFHTLFAPWYRTDLPDISDARKIGQALCAHWCVEMGELDTLKRSEKEALKEFLVRRVDKYDPKYSRGEIHAPRQCVIGGTTNDIEFLDSLDSAVRRRFWPIEVMCRLDIDWLTEHRDEIFAEARDAYLAGEKWWYEEESALDEAKESYVMTSSIEDMLRTYLDSPGALRSLDRKNVTAIYHLITGVTQNKQPITKSQEIELSAALRRTKGLHKSRNNSNRVWLVDDHLKLVKK